VCVYICIYLCIDILIYIRTYIYIYIYIYIHTIAGKLSYAGEEIDTFWQLLMMCAKACGLAYDMFNGVKSLYLLRMSSATMSSR